MSSERLNGSQLAGAAREQFLQHVQDDDDFHYDFNLVNDYIEREKDNPKKADRINEIKIAIRDKWHLTDEEYLWLNIGLLPPTKVAKLSIHPLTHTPIIELEPNSNLDQVVAAYKEFDELRRRWGIKPIKRRSALIDPSISYAVFKGLQQGKKFVEIFNDLTDETSPLYSERAARLFHTPDELRVHYNQHKP